MKTCLITGGGGFIGSHLCDRFLKEGWRVVSVDNMVTGDPGNLAHLAGSKRFTHIGHDVTRPIDVGEKLDMVLHFASIASPKDYRKQPIKTLKVGTLGTHNALGLAKANDAKFVLASTSEVYGDPEVNPQKESYWGNVNPIGVRSCYDESKRAGEALTMAYHRVHGLDTSIVRIFNTYGPRMRAGDGRVIPTFVNQCLEGRNMTVFGDGSQTRSFCYISDLVEGIWRLSGKSYSLPVNMGNPNERSIKELAILVKEMAGSKSGIAFRPLPKDDPRRRCPDISRAGKVLGWKPSTGLSEGLEKTIEYFRERAEGKPPG